MVTETAQLLSTAILSFDSSIPGLYRKTHTNHPVTIWTRTSRANFLWLLEYGFAISEEYTRRYGKVHASSRIIKQCAEYSQKIPEGPQTPFALCMPDKYKQKCPVQSYRAYYMGEKRAIAAWKFPAQKPEWFV